VPALSSGTDGICAFALRLPGGRLFVTGCLWGGVVIGGGGFEGVW